MADLSEILSAFKALDSGVTRLATSKAIAGANEQVNQMNASIADEQERTMGLRQIANSLTMQLSQIGAPNEDIAQVSQSIAPKAPLIQSAEQGYISGTPLERQRSKELLDRERATRMEQIKTMYGSKLDQKSLGILERSTAKFNSLSAKTFEALDASQKLFKAITNKESLTDEVLKTFAAKASGEVGNLTEAERNAFAGGRSLLDRIMRSTKKNIWGTLLDSDRQQLMNLAKIFNSGAKGALMRRADLLSGQASKLTGRDKAEVMDLMLPADALMLMEMGDPAVPGQASAPAPGGLGAPSRYLK